MGISYPHIYRMLKKFGHSPSKAIEIIIAGLRGDRHWVVIWKEKVDNTSELS